jgi:tRNA(Ile)-lysidine synthase TilS/MesJ
MQLNPKIIRPLLKVPKKQIYAYAKEHNLKWIEDPTNKDTKYTRNYVRQVLMPKLKEDDRQTLLVSINNIAALEQEKQDIFATMSQLLLESSELKRQQFINLPTEVAEEFLVYWLRQSRIKQVDRPAVRKLNVIIKTAKPGSYYPINKKSGLKVDQKKVLLITTGQNA